MSDWDSVKITPHIAPHNEYEHATIFDKAIWNHGVSKILHAMNESRNYDRTVHFTIYDYLKSINRGTSGRDYL